MLAIKKLIVVILSLIIITVLSGVTEARSVYVIADTGTALSDIPLIQAYDIVGSTLVLQTDYGSEHPLAISLTIDPESGFMFITHEEHYGEGGNLVEIVNAKTLQYVDTVTAPGASDLAGIVFDSIKQKVYAVDRGKKYLYVYNWYPKILSLVPDGDPIELEGLTNNSVGGAWGLALDEENSRLWVTSNETKVRFYNTNDWSHDPNNDFIILSQKTVSIALDLTNEYVYTGTAWVDPYPTYYLSQYDLSDGNETLEDIGAEVIGIAVDQQTSLVYLTTFGSSGDSNEPYPKDRLFVYDANLSEKCYSDDIGNPAGVAVAGDVYYKPTFPTLTLVKEANIVDCVVPGEITYTITYDANSDSDTNVVITDYLPAEVYFISASGPNMVYDIFTDANIVTWNIGTLSPGDSNSVTLTVVVNERAEPLETITNLCEIEGDQYRSFAALDTNVCCYGGDIIYVDGSATAGFDTGTTWANAYLDLQDALERADAGCGSQIRVAAGTYQPSKRTTSSEPESATFQLLNGIPIYGGFPSGGGQRNWTVNETILDGTLSEVDGTLGESGLYRIMQAENVNEATILDGFIIRNGLYGIKCFDYAEPNIINCKIEHNKERGIYCSSSNPNIINCVIVNNGNASFIGGGIYCHYSSPKITNCTLIKNTANEGGGIYNISYSSPIVKNCILWDNSTYEISGSGAIVTYSDINQVGYSGNGNINADPCFYNPDDPNSFHLMADSPCIDKGNNSAVPTSILTDIDGEDRIINGKGDPNVDMGADEYYLSPADFNHDEIVNFIDYAMFANAWQTDNADISLDDDIDVDYNDLALFCKDWLWIAAWNQTLRSMMSEGMGGGMDQGLGLMDESYLSAQAEQQPEQVIQLDIEELLKWLEELWLDPEIREVITEDEWLEFIESVKNSE